MADESIITKVILVNIALDFQIRGKITIENPRQKNSGAKFCPGKIYKKFLRRQILPQIFALRRIFENQKSTAFAFIMDETYLHQISFLWA